MSGQCPCTWGNLSSFRPVSRGTGFGNRNTRFQYGSTVRSVHIDIQSDGLRQHSEEYRSLWYSFAVYAESRIAGCRLVIECAEVEEINEVAIRARIDSLGTGFNG